MADVPLSLLETARVASPCHMRWEDMEGEGRTRHCGECRLDVHDFSDLTAGEAEALLARILEGERVCGVIYRRPDGTILTRDCPVGLRAARLELARAGARVAAMIGLCLTAVLALGSASRAERLRNTEPFATLCDKLNPTTVLPPVAGAIAPGPPAVAGRICVPAALGEIGVPDSEDE